MDPELDVAQYIAACYEWKETHPFEADEVGFEFLEAEDTSLNFKASEMLFQLIFPLNLLRGDFKSDDIFIAMNLDNLAPDSLMIALNEKLERVRVGPCSLVQVLDTFAKVLRSFKGKRGIIHNQTMEVQRQMGIPHESMVGRSKHQTQAVLHVDNGVDVANDPDLHGDDPDSDDDEGGMQNLGSDDDSDVFGEYSIDDFENEDVQNSVEKFKAHNIRKRPGGSEDHKGYLYGVARGARERCEEARQHTMNSSLSNPAKPGFSGLSAHSYMNDILQFCNFSTVPNLPWIRLQAEVAGVVNDVKLASALGLSFGKTLHLFLEFDKLFWSETFPRKTLEVSRVTVRLESVRPGRTPTEIDRSCELLAKDSDEEYDAECKKIPGQRKSVSYGIDVLLPELIAAFFKYRSGHAPQTIRPKPWENRGLDEALQYFAAIDNPFIGLVCFIGTQLRALPSWCAVCWSQLPASVWRLRTCQNDLCLYEFEELGLGATIYHEIQESPEVVNLELSLACAAATPSRDVFEPFPAFFLNDNEVRGRSGWFSRPSRQADDQKISVMTAMPATHLPERCLGREKNNKNLISLLETLQSLPSISELEECRDEFSLKRKLSKVAFALQKQRDLQPQRDRGGMWLFYDLMRFIVSTNRLSLRLLTKSEELPVGSNVQYQFVVLHDSPEKEAVFEERKCQHGSFFAFHGSKATNWYSILRNGLRSMSKTRYMSTGAAYGDGIYLADNFELSYSYAREYGQSSSTTWKNGIFKDGLTVIAICEVITGSANGPTCRQENRHAPLGIYVVPPGKEDDVSVRYLMVMKVSGLPGESHVTGSRIDWSILQDSVCKVNGESIVLRTHYDELRLRDQVQQQQRLLDHRMEAFRRVTEEMTCLHIDPGQLSDKVPIHNHTGSSCHEYLKMGERPSSGMSRRPNDTYSGKHEIVAQGLVNAPKRLKENKTAATTISTTTATAIATQAIAKELRNVLNEICKAKQENSCGDAYSFLANITIDIPNESDLYVWHVRLHQNLFKGYPQLFKDLQNLAVLNQESEACVLLEVSYSGMYPFQPPFIRVIRPRFVFHTGHVTVGGSICMELLTESGWLPSFSFENVLVQIVNAFIEGEGRLDTCAMGKEYSVKEAQEAFNRVATVHGWKVSSRK